MFPFFFAGCKGCIGLFRHPLCSGLRMAPGGPGGGVANQTAIDILTNPIAIAINQQYCHQSDCGIASGGDLLSVLQMQAQASQVTSSDAVVWQQSQPPIHAPLLKPQPFPSLGEHNCTYTRARANSHTVEHKCGLTCTARHS